MRQPQPFLDVVTWALHRAPIVWPASHDEQRTRMPSAFMSSQVIHTGSMFDFEAPLPSRTFRRYIILRAEVEAGADNRPRAGTDEVSRHAIRAQQGAVNTQACSDEQPLIPQHSSQCDGGGVDHRKLSDRSVGGTKQPPHRFATHAPAPHNSTSTLRTSPAARTCAPARTCASGSTARGPSAAGTPAAHPARPLTPARTACTA